jgi:SAM-dependent methyltransferase
MEFICNICGHRNLTNAESFDRESASCSFCGSNLRRRSLIHALAVELFGSPLALPDFPRMKSVRGLGLSDAENYACRLADRFDYRNTYYDREPRLDITELPECEESKYDFLIASEVFEHVTPPVERAFRQAHRCLKPNGVFILTVPYSLELSMSEHFPDLHQYGLTQLGKHVVLVNRTRNGDLQAFEDVVFHGGCSGKVLELRVFNQAEIMRMLTDAGFRDARVHSENHLESGIMHSEPCSLPIVARKGEFALGRESTRELVEAWRDQRPPETFWQRAARKLGLI